MSNSIDNTKKNIQKYVQEELIDKINKKSKAMWFRFSDTLLEYDELCDFGCDFRMEDPYFRKNSICVIAEEVVTKKIILTFSLFLLPNIDNIYVWKEIDTKKEYRRLPINDFISHTGLLCLNGYILGPLHSTVSLPSLQLIKDAICEYKENLFYLSRLITKLWVTLSQESSLSIIIEPHGSCELSYNVMVNEYIKITDVAKVGKTRKDSMVTEVLSSKIIKLKELPNIYSQFSLGKVFIT